MYEKFKTLMVTMKCARDNMVLVLQDLGAMNEPDNQVLVYEWRTGELKLWFNGNLGQWLKTTFGQKCIVPPPLVGAKGAPLTLLDFNPIDVAKALAVECHLQATALGEGGQAWVEENYCAEGVLLGDYTGDESEYEGKDVVETYDSPHKSRPQPRAVTWIMDPLNDPDGCFAHTVYSSLPYTVHSLQDKYRYDDFVLDEESIIGIQEDDEENVKEIHVLHCG
ncbi:hypothetical protein P691DRAFT_790310 [Macrolepiota fuliginosa MF-IS2]|uniref:Uncharacterized protein n=1 Tax=Macrolepiota fuliginosa MF-IS2 TaxID=1400762 RepID=A0A9P5X2Z4_9AGAR|nr:hypothetical protein P691DRAFT_790310 [Macrolepiota fuliginosa MF-IS2]